MATSKKPLDSASVAQTNFSASDYKSIKTVAAIPTLWFFMYPKTNYYVSMGSQHMYRSYAEILLGRSAVDEAELESMNLRINFWFSIPDYKAVTYGDSIDSAGNKVTHILKQNCKPDVFQLDSSLSGSTRVMVVPAGGSVGVRTDLIATSYDKIIWQSKKDKAVLITRFVNNAVVDWKVLSLAKTLPEKTRNLILDQVKNLGLNL